MPPTRATLPDVLLGKSRQITRFRSRLRALARLKAPILLVGEAGMRRGSVAMVLHRWSPLAHQPLTKLRCGAESTPTEPLPAGTFYLENVELLPPQEQPRWLRHLRGAAPAPRIVASTTSQDLVGVAEEGEFDTELAAELTRLTARIPPLRERPEDLQPIAQALLSRIAPRLGRPTPKLTKGASARLAEYPWRENLAELERALELAAAYTEDDEISQALIEEALHELETPLSRITTQRTRRERRLLLDLYKKYGTYTGVAEELGITRNAAKYRFSKHGLLPPRHSANGTRTTTTS